MNAKAIAKILIVMMILTSMTISVVCAAASKDEQRQHIRDITQVTMNKLYGLHPEVKQEVEKAAGYAAFGSWGAKLGIFGSAQGKGMAVNNKTKKETFMNMREAAVGLGIGATTYNTVFIFATEEALNDFTENGWQFGGEVNATATDSVNGDSFQGAAIVAPGIWMYTMTDKGLAAEITAKGTKYFKNDLN